MKKIIESKSLKINYCNDYNIITIILTHNCNYNCHYCYDSNNRKIKKDLFINKDFLYIFLKNYQEVFKNKKTQIEILGGEPTLHHDLLSICEMLDKFENIFFVRIISNGSADISVYENIFKILKQKLFISISIHHKYFQGIEKFLKIKNLTDNYELKYMIDNFYSIDDILHNFNLLKDYNINLNALFNVDYPIEYNELLSLAYKDENRSFEITYENNEKTIKHKDELLLNENIFKGMFCDALQTTFKLSADMKFSVFCNKKHYNAISLNDLKKLYYSLPNLVCDSNFCHCYTNFRKYK